MGKGVYVITQRCEHFLNFDTRKEADMGDVEQPDRLIVPTPGGELAQDRQVACIGYAGQDAAARRQIRLEALERSPRVVHVLKHVGQYDYVEMARPVAFCCEIDFLQQAIAQIISAQWEPHFHPHSYGFRPQRSAHQAVRHVQASIREGYGWVVDMDLQAFFDRVNHDRLMARLQSRCRDRDLLRLINRYLKAGVRVGEMTEATTMGVPQGGPLSPVLANVVLDELDWELERCGHRFARYADDCNIMVGSLRAGQRVMASVKRFVSDTLRLTVNPLKSAVDRPAKRKFLGFTVSRNGAKLKVADKAIDKLKQRIRELTRRTRGHLWPTSSQS